MNPFANIEKTLIIAGTILDDLGLEKNYFNYLLLLTNNSGNGLKIVKSYYEYLDSNGIKDAYRYECVSHFLDGYAFMDNIQFPVSPEKMN